MLPSWSVSCLVQADCCGNWADELGRSSSLSLASGLLSSRVLLGCVPNLCKLDSTRVLVRVLMRICITFADRGIPWLAWDAGWVFSCIKVLALLLAPSVALMDHDRLIASPHG